MLAVIAGQGALPGAVARAQTTPPLVCSLAGNDPADLSVDVHFRVEHLGSFLSDLSTRGVREVCFCGRIDRPAVDPTQIDAQTAPMVPTLAAAVAGGEDKALRAIATLFEEAGLKVVGAATLAPDLLPARGCPTRTPVPPHAESDVTVALNVLGDQAKTDVGQACVIRDRTVVAREETAGTDAMLDGLGPTGPSDDPFGAAMDAVGSVLGTAADWLSGPDGAPPASPRRGLLFKAPKPGQDRRVDLPTIGSGTVARAAQAGLEGIVIEEGGVMVLDLADVIADLDAVGMFLWVR
ncbi:UDP-2,3-diacylglucosamine diphosphatase LpxI [uncultured Tateyamaria sp.]|uniref:LpxI family protein n=1 Tax=uncultured Tateyamaria sp. TaxID=455651 RepID=UPI0026252D37|nr:UDP-2,3-diacylglucosamine diphosphatase LpxI [uncultured Tateyamaria sp.]